MGQSNHGNSDLTFSLNMRTIQLKSQLTVILTHYHNRITVLKPIKFCFVSDKTERLSKVFIIPQFTFKAL